MKLSERLAAAATLVRDGVRIVDVGTDHAYLPAELVMSGKATHAIACDIGEGPLDNARETVERFSLGGRIELRLSDGLEKVSPDEVDDVLICGRGGELIARILAASDWVRDGEKHLVLQPMSPADDLRVWLCDNGFCVKNELVVREVRRLYIVMDAVYDGKKRVCTPEYPYIGTLSPLDGERKEYLERQLRRVNRHADSLLNTDSHFGERERLLGIAAAIERRLKGEDLP